MFLFYIELCFRENFLLLARRYWGWGKIWGVKIDRWGKEWRWWRVKLVKCEAETSSKQALETSFSCLSLWGSIIDNQRKMISDFRNLLLCFELDFLEFELVFIQFELVSMFSNGIFYFSNLTFKLFNLIIKIILDYFKHVSNTFLIFSCRCTQSFIDFPSRNSLESLQSLSSSPNSPLCRLSTKSPLKFQFKNPAKKAKINAKWIS
jgi:hypothetical protein